MRLSSGRKLQQVKTGMVALLMLTIIFVAAYPAFTQSVSSLRQRQFSRLKLLGTCVHLYFASYDDRCFLRDFKGSLMPYAKGEEIFRSP